MGAPIAPQVVMYKTSLSALVLPKTAAVSPATVNSVGEPKTTSPMVLPAGTTPSILSKLVVTQMLPAASNAKSSIDVAEATVPTVSTAAPGTGYPALSMAIR